MYRLAKGGVDRYAVSFQCTPPVEKAIYHGSKTWALWIIPLHGVGDLPEAKVKEIKTDWQDCKGQPADAAHRCRAPTELRPGLDPLDGRGYTPMSDGPERRRPSQGDGGPRDVRLGCADPDSTAAPGKPDRTPVRRLPAA